MEQADGDCFGLRLGDPAGRLMRRFLGQGVMAVPAADMRSHTSNTISRDTSGALRSNRMSATERVANSAEAKGKGLCLGMKLTGALAFRSIELPR